MPHGRLDHLDLTMALHNASQRQILCLFWPHHWASSNLSQGLSDAGGQRGLLISCASTSSLRATHCWIWDIAVLVNNPSCVSKYLLLVGLDWRMNTS